MGRTGVSLTPITFGAMRVESGQVVDNISRPLLYALEKGINCIDTGRAYGKSEEIVGKTLRAFSGGPRPFIASKIAPLPTGDWRHYVPLEKSFTRQSIHESVETSLGALGVEVIDLIQLHQWYYLWTHRPEWLKAFEDLKRQGKVRFIGISAQDHEHDAVLQVVDAVLIDAVQFVFNIFESRPLVSLLPLAAERGVGTIARCVLDCGGLSGLLDDNQLAHGNYFPKAAPGEYRRRLEQIQRDPVLQGIPAAELALRFVLSSDALTTVTLSMADATQVDAAIAAADKGPLPAPVFERLYHHHSWFKNLWA
jgi:aryl-alcohol dehydrogenase-like predicted oxidoreductase